MAFPTSDIPDLRAARKLASQLSLDRPGHSVDVTMAPDGTYRLGFVQVPSYRSLGTYINGKMWGNAQRNPVPQYGIVSISGWRREQGGYDSEGELYVPHWEVRTKVGKYTINDFRGHTSDPPFELRFEGKGKTIQGLGVEHESVIIGDFRSLETAQEAAEKDLSKRLYRENPTGSKTTTIVLSAIALVGLGTLLYFSKKPSATPASTPVPPVPLPLNGGSTVVPSSTNTGPSIEPGT